MAKRISRDNIGSGFGGFNFGGFGDLPPEQVGMGYWDFGAGYIGNHPAFGARLEFNNSGTVSSPNGLGIQATSGTLSLYGQNATIITGGKLYKGGVDSANEILMVYDNDIRYAYKSHSHSQYYKSGDSPYFSSVIAANGYNGNISVMNRSGSGGYGITITYGIVTAVANI